LCVTSDLPSAARTDAKTGRRLIAFSIDIVASTVALIVKS